MIAAPASWRGWLWAMAVAAAVATLFFARLPAGSLRSWNHPRIEIGGAANPDSPPAIFQADWRRHYLPTTALSLWADRAAFGRRPFWFHLHNLLGHVTGTLVLMMLFRQLGMRQWLAAAMALAWAALPLSRLDVIYPVDGRSLVAGCLFAFIAALCCSMAARGTSSVAVRRCSVLGTIAAALSAGAAVQFAALPLAMAAASLAATPPGGWRRLPWRQLSLPVLSAMALIAVSHFITDCDRTPGTDLAILHAVAMGLAGLGIEMTFHSRSGTR